MNCPVCNFTKCKLKYSVDNFDFQQCQKCKSLFLSEYKNPDYYRSLYSQEYFEKDYKKGEKFNYFSDAEKDISSSLVRLETIENFFGDKKGKLLDVGCANGNFLHVAKQKSWEVEGVEISEVAADFARNHFGIMKVYPALKDIEGENKYDVITFYHVLEHLPDPAFHVQRSYELLRPGGLLIIEVPNYRSVDFIFNKNIRRRIFSLPYHVVLFSFKGLNDLLKKNNFTILEKKIFLSSSVFNIIKKILLRKVKSNNIQDNKSVPASRLVAKKNLKSKLYYQSKKILAKVFPGTAMIFIVRKD